MKSVQKYLIGLFLLLTIASCRKANKPVDSAVFLDIPEGFTMPIIPEDNQLTEKRIELGKLLFFDKKLSRDSTISCASCHLPSKAFSDVVALSEGVEARLGLRNSPPLFNLAWHDKFFKDGGVPTLELQILAPIEDHREMDLSILEAVDRILANPLYVDLSNIAYNRAPDAFVLTRSIAAFERTLVSGNSRVDQYLHQGQTDALNESEIRGLDLYNTLNCSTCHSGFNYTDYSFRNNGLYEMYSDSGRTRITLNPNDRGKFKVASLRNVELTAPYMHDGSVETLAEVIEHYNTGGSNHVNKDSAMQPLNLTIQQKDDLLHFLQALTDDSFVNNENFIP